MNSASAVIIAAAISLVVGIITYLGTVQAAKQQVTGQAKIAKGQIEGQVAVAQQQINAQLDEVRQTQFKDILAKRIEVYPKLWQILQASLSDRLRTGESVNKRWAKQLLQGLLAWHSQNGIFLTQASYSRFAELRAEVLTIYRKCEKGQQPTNNDLERLDVIWSGDASKNKSGLATELKNDLGSYTAVAVSVKSSEQQAAAQ
jgi:hypothetical protein